jgi:hypothetical protein
MFKLPFYLTSTGLSLKPRFGTIPTKFFDGKESIL